MADSFDVAIVGGGIVGLLAAYTLKQRDPSLQIVVLDQQQPGRAASWAGAGILPPSPLAALENLSALDVLARRSRLAFPGLAADLHERSGIECEFLERGGIELLATAEDAAAHTRRWTEVGIRWQPWPGESADIPTSLTPSTLRLPIGSTAFWLPDYAQIRNPRLLQALLATIRRLGVVIEPEAAVVGVRTCGGRVGTVQRDAGREIAVGQVVFAAGAWSGSLLSRLGVTVPVTPLRGQMLAFAPSADAPRELILHGKHYIVPRRDGTVLVGSTEEAVGFDGGVTAAAATDLQAVVGALLPAYADRMPAYQWAGLRPASPYASPIIGPVPGYDNAWLATGHFRRGVQWSPATAELLADLILGQPSFVPAASFALDADRRSHRVLFDS